MFKIEHITKQNVEEHVGAGLRGHIGPLGTISYKEASVKLGVDQRTLEAWVRGETAPSVHNMLKLFAFLGSDFANHVLSLACLGDVQQMEPEGLDDFALNAGVTESIAALGRALEDGRIDHVERAELLPLLQTLSGKIDQWCYHKDGKK